MANVRRLKRRVRKAEAFVEVVSEHAMAMEEPLRHAGNLCRAIEIAYRPDDDEMEALAFVAGEAFARLEFVQQELRGLFDALKSAP